MHSYQRAIAIAVILFGGERHWHAPAMARAGGCATRSKGTVGAMVGLVTSRWSWVSSSSPLFRSSPPSGTRLSRWGPSLSSRSISRSSAMGPGPRKDAQGSRGVAGALARPSLVRPGPQPHTAEETARGAGRARRLFRQPSTLDRCAAAMPGLARCWRGIAHTQMLMARQLANPFPPYVLVVVVCWAAALFLATDWSRRRSASSPCPRRRDRHRQRGLPDPGTQPAYTGVVRLCPPASTDCCKCLEKRTAKGA